MRQAKHSKKGSSLQVGDWCREMKWLAQGHMGSLWQSYELNPEPSPNPRPFFLSPLAKCDIMSLLALLAPRTQTSEQTNPNRLIRFIPNCLQNPFPRDIPQMNIHNDTIVCRQGRAHIQKKYPESNWCRTPSLIRLRLIQCHCLCQCSTLFRLFTVPLPLSQIYDPGWPISLYTLAQ